MQPQENGFLRQLLKAKELAVSTSNNAVFASEIFARDAKST
jgi:hypothetical protein